tara:strand:+ start:311 stop:901 length:591 start_codon:yes stop_codon:yes gene_type:complete
MNEKLNKILPSYIATIILFILTYFITTRYLILAVTLAITIIGLLNTDLRLPLALAFMVGVLSDISLNLGSAIFQKNFKDSRRSKSLQIYFNSMGIAPAAIFGGVLAAGMIANTYAITESFNDPLPLWAELLIGFGVGALWGVVGHYSLAMRPFKVFYDNTSGYIESRFWDGITIPFVMIIMYFVSKSSDLNFYPVS